jgi:hypothetical protein
VCCIPGRVLVTGQVGCLEDVQNWHIELSHDFHLLFVEILYAGITCIVQSPTAALILHATCNMQLLYVL